MPEKTRAALAAHRPVHSPTSRRTRDKQHAVVDSVVVKRLPFWKLLRSGARSRRLGPSIAWRLDGTSSPNSLLPSNDLSPIWVSPLQQVGSRPVGRINGSANTNTNACVGGSSAAKARTRQLRRRTSVYGGEGSARGERYV